MTNIIIAELQKLKAEVYDFINLTEHAQRNIKERNDKIAALHKELVEQPIEENTSAISVTPQEPEIVEVSAPVSEEPHA